jgi:iron-sulfur cluster assembly protein
VEGTVLTMTSDATEAIERILSDADVPDGAGLRIELAGVAQSKNGSQTESTTLRIVIAPEAPGGDEVVEQEGARVFLEPTVAVFLDDKLLDINSSDGGIAFTLSDQS